jgi:biotin synthase
MNHSEILRYLRNPNEHEMMPLFRHADTVRRANVGEGVHLSGSIEVSSEGARRFRMNGTEIVASAKKAVAGGCTGVILHSCDDPDLDRDMIAESILAIKRRSAVEITLGFGERSEEEVAAWRSAGADRYLLRGTSPTGKKFPRKLVEIGYRIGHRLTVGTPGQSFQGLARDIAVLEKFNPDLIWVGPHLPHESGPAQQVPASAGMVYRVIALCRRLYPRNHIVLDTAITAVNPVNGRELGLLRGGNMLVANATPKKYRNRPAAELAENSIDHIRTRVRGIGRRIASAPGLPSATRFL